MLAELTPEQFNERWAAYKLDGWGEEWRQAYTIIAGICNKIHLAMGGNETGLVAADDFLPPLLRDGKRKKKHGKLDDLRRMYS